MHSQLMAINLAERRLHEEVGPPCSAGWMCLESKHHLLTFCVSVCVCMGHVCFQSVPALYFKPLRGIPPPAAFHARLTLWTPSPVIPNFVSFGFLQSPVYLSFFIELLGDYEQFHSINTFKIPRGPFCVKHCFPSLAVWSFPYRDSCVPVLVWGNVTYFYFHIFQMEYFLTLADYELIDITVRCF